MKTMGRKPSPESDTFSLYRFSSPAGKMKIPILPQKRIGEFLFHHTASRSLKAYTQSMLFEKARQEPAGVEVRGSMVLLVELAIVGQFSFSSPPFSQD